jgi:hypothetical protein
MEENGMSKELEELLAKVIRQPGKIEAMSDGDRRAYNASASRASRLRKRETRTTGMGKPTTDITRDLLADIAIMMLASDAPGHDTIMNGLKTYFADRVGFPSKIKSDCRKGKLRPRLIGKEQDAPARTG